MKPGKILLELTDLRPLVHRATIPDDNHWTTKVPKQLSQKPGNGGVIEVIVDETAEVKSEVPTLGRDGQSADDRNFVPAPALMTDSLNNLRRLPFERPRATNQRRQQKAAFVDENQMGP